jgi:hypothetical protein
MDFSSITKYLPKKLSIVQIVIILAVLAVIIYIVVKHREIKEGLADIASAYSKIPREAGAEVPMVESSEQPFVGDEFEGKGSTEITAEDLLPMTPEGVDNFNRQFPLADPSLDSNNFLTAGFNIGINTVGSSNRNANMSIRPDPVIPEVANGPWNQSTITRDTERRPLDIC